jgi:hypothetical protein
MLKVSQRFGHHFSRHSQGLYQMKVSNQLVNQVTVFGKSCLIAKIYFPATHLI